MMNLEGAFRTSTIGRTLSAEQQTGIAKIDRLKGLRKRLFWAWAEHRVVRELAPPVKCFEGAQQVSVEYFLSMEKGVSIDWQGMLDWLKEHWVEVLRIFLSLLSIFFLLAPVPTLGAEQEDEEGIEGILPWRDDDWKETRAMLHDVSGFLPNFKAMVESITRTSEEARALIELSKSNGITIVIKVNNPEV